MPPRPKRSSRRAPAAAAAGALEALVRRQINALNRQDLDGLMALYADDAVLEFPGSARITGKASIRKAYERYFHDWEEKVTLSRVSVSGRTVSADGVSQGRHRAVSLDIPGRVVIPLRRYRHTFSVSWEIRRGKIARHRVTYDVTDVVRQLLGI